MLYIILFLSLYLGGCGLLLTGADGGPMIDRLKETNQDIYGCIQLDMASRGGRVNLLLMPKGMPLPPETKIPTC